MSQSNGTPAASTPRGSTVKIPLTSTPQSKIATPGSGTKIDKISKDPTVQPHRSKSQSHHLHSQQNHSHTQHLHHGKPKLVKSLKLISVSFKELALDSPTFRAYVNHSFNQVDGFRVWIENLLILKKNYNNQNIIFENSLSQLRNLFESSTLTDGIIDSDYTSLDLNFTYAGFKEVLAEILKFTKPNDTIDKLTNELIHTGLLQFTTVRRKFETTQNMHDLVLGRYCATPKTRDTVAAREDALQLAEIRKQYIELALDTAVAITDITRLINNFLIEVVTLIWRSNLDLKILTKNYNSFSKYVERIHQFEKASRLSMDNLRKDMINSKTQTVETALKQHAPSKELSDYDSAAINPSTMLQDFEDPREEKHGWLFMKTTTGEPTRQVWVRRWCFVKDGIFGMLNLSPSKTFVQELDKVGVGLCNIRYYPEEERRFCFELKTISNTVILQAETLHQLKGWFFIFNKQKTKFINSGDEIAFNRYPPVLRDFVCTSPTTSDMDMTTVENIPSLSDLVHRETLKFDVGLLSTIYNAPICTLISKEAIAAHGTTSPTNIPTAITANIWGSVNWGNYYLLDKRHFPHMETPKDAQHLLSEQSFFNRYPSYYPSRLIALDCQLRSLLGTVFPKDEFVLLEFRAIWIPNTKQELVGRCYVTQNCIYFYMSSLGFVSLILRNLKEIISFENVSEDNFDTLKIYELSGLSMKLKLYLDSAKLLKDQMTVILDNKLSDDPKSLHTLLKELENLRSAHAKQEIERLRTNYEAKKEIVPSVVTTTLKKIQPLDLKSNYNKEMKLIWDKVYDIPSKLLFHILLGDESFILQKISPFIDARNENISMALWNQTDKQQLKRSFMTDTILDTNEFRTTKINQTIETLINSKYYNIYQTTQYFKFPRMNAYRIETRVIIYSLNLKNSKLLVYSKIHFDEKERYQLRFLNFFNAHFLNKVSRHKVEALDNDIKEAVKKIGPHVKVVKLIRLYGPITKSEHSELVADNDEVMIVSKLAFRRVILKKILNTILGAFIFLFRLVLQFVNTLRLNYILVLLLGLSVGYNLLLTGKSVRSYWVVSCAENMIDQYVNDDVVSRAIFLKDVEELVDFKYTGKNSKCFAQFQRNSLILNPNSTVDNELKRSYRELGLQRNKLMVNLKMINDLEYHLLELEWNNFLTQELLRCDLIGGVPLDSEDNLDELKLYCASCQLDLTQTELRGNSLV